MVSYSTSDFKPGLKILIDGEPCEIIEEEIHSKEGNWHWRERRNEDEILLERHSGRK